MQSWSQVYRLADWKPYEDKVSEYFTNGKMSLYSLILRGANHPQVEPWLDIDKLKRNHLKHSTGAPVKTVMLGEGMKAIEDRGEHKYRKNSMKSSFLMCPGCLLLHGKINRGMPHCSIYFCKVRH
jgi:hypothetical protein